MSTVSLKHTADGMKLYMIIPEAYVNVYPNVDELRTYLAGNGVVYGVKDDILKKMSENCICNKRMLVAEGKMPGAGTAGKIEYLIDIEKKGKPKKLKDGKVDLKDLQTQINVKRGQPIARRIPPVPGKNGRTVYNTEAKPLPVKDAVLKAGSGTGKMSGDANTLVVEIDGGIKIDSTGVISVVQSKTISSDIDYGTGNISFSGDLDIRGSLRSGFSISSQGDLTLRGNVEDSRIVCKGNLMVTGGAAGTRKGYIECGGDACFHHVERFTMKIGQNLDVSGHIVHSDIEVKKNVKAKSVVGGKISAGAGLELQEAGSVSETKTVLDMGMNIVFYKEKDLLMRKISHVASKNGVLKESIYELVKSEMDEDGGLDNDNEKKLLDLKQDYKKVESEYKDCLEKMENLNRKLKELPVPVFQIKKIYPNTIISAGDKEKRIIRQEIHDLIITMKDGKIKINK